MSRGAASDLAAQLRSPRVATLRGKLAMVARLSWPAIMAQLSTLLMEYIDAAMVGHLGAEPAASIGLIATTTWLFGGLGTATVMGFSVQVAHLLGGGKDAEARSVVRQGTVIVTAVGILVALLAVAIAPGLPHWLGGKGVVCDMSTSYFSIFGASMPVVYLTFMAGAMLRSSGNMLVPGVIAVVMCTLDVVFNFFMIYPAHAIETPWGVLTLPGAGLGVTGAAIGTAMAQVVGCVFLLWYLLRRSPALSRPWSRARGFVGTWWRLNGRVMRHAVSVASPLALERVVMCGAQILITAIVAPLGNTAIAANAFAVTAESLCYMPGYGIGEAATTLVGQSLGAGRRVLAVSFGRITMTLGIAIMGVLGVVMWFCAYDMIAFFTPDVSVRELGAMALRTEAWAEPMFGAAIVGYGIAIGARYATVPAFINFGSIWAVRLTLSAILAPSMGLYGVWLAMCIELCFRGALFVLLFVRGRWLKHATAIAAESLPADT